MRKIIIAVAIIATMIPATAKADCSGFLDCLFGFSERVETRQAAMTERERIQAEAQAEIARTQAEQAERGRQADAEVERVKQLRFESEADRDIAIAQANADAEEYKAMIASLTEINVTSIQMHADYQIAALQEQSKIAIEGITQTGHTERWRIGFGWATVIIGLLIMGAAILTWMRRQSAHVMMVLPDVSRPTPIAADARQLPWYSDAIEIVEVKHASLARKN